MHIGVNFGFGRYDKTVPEYQVVKGETDEIGRASCRERVYDDV